MRRAFVIAWLVLAPGLALAQPPPVTVTAARIRWLPGDLPLGGYFKLENRGSQTLRLVGVASPAFARVEMHRSLPSGDMVPVSEIPVPPHGAIAFSPGGYHLMMMHRARALQVGEHVTVEFRFADGGTVTFPFLVQPPDMQ
ncbi:MAG: copper chaperone PCu(A)C [Gammaproteobacteria bacterium]